MKPLVMTAAVTVFDDNGDIDPDGNRRVWDYLIREKVDGIVVMGSTGEFPGMTMETQKRLLDLAVEHIAGRARLLAGTCRILPDETVELTRYAHGRGVDGVMVMSPYYFGYDDRGVEAYYDRIASCSDGDVYLYNYPERSGYNISPRATVNLLRRHRNIVGYKSTVRDFSHTASIIDAVRDEFPRFLVFSGYDNHFLPNLEAGGAGVIGGLPNLAPEIFAALAEAYAAGDGEAAAAQHRRLEKLVAIYGVSTPSMPALKKAMQLRGLDINAACTFPMPPVDAGQTRRIADLLRDCGLGKA